MTLSSGAIFRERRSTDGIRSLNRRRVSIPGDHLPSEQSGTAPGISGSEARAVMMFDITAKPETRPEARPTSAEQLAECLHCPYEPWAHLDGRCPDENEAAQYVETREQRQRRLRAEQDSEL